MSGSADGPRNRLRNFFERLRGRSELPAARHHERRSLPRPGQQGNHVTNSVAIDGTNPLIALATRAAIGGWDTVQLHEEAHLAIAKGIEPEAFASAIHALDAGTLPTAVRTAVRHVLLSIGLISENAGLWRARFGTSSLAGLASAVSHAPPGLRLAMADHCFEFGNALYEAQLLPEAEQALQHGCDLYRALAATRRGTHEYRADLAACLNNLANTLSRLNRVAEAEALYRESLVERRLLAQGGTLADRSALATSLNNLGTSLSRQGRLREAEEFLAEALASYRLLADDDPDMQPDVAMALFNLGQNLSEQRRYQEAEPHLREVAEMERRQVSALANITRRGDSDGDEQLLRNYVGTLLALGMVILKQRRYAEAEAIARHAISLQPSSPRAWEGLAHALREQRRFSESEVAFRRIASLYAALSSVERSGMKTDIAVSRYNLGVILADQGRYHEAEPLYREAIATFRQLAEKSPDAFLPQLADAYNNLGNTLHSQHRFDEAEAAFRASLSMYQSRERLAPAAYQPDVAMILLGLGIVLADQGRFQEAEEAYGDAEESGRRLTAVEPATYHPLLAAILNNHGAMLLSQRRWRESEEFLREALALRRELVEAQPAIFSPVLGSTLMNLGNLRRDLARFSEAARNYAEAEQIYRQLVARARHLPARPGKDIAESRVPTPSPARSGAGRADIARVC